MPTIPQTTYAPVDTAAADAAIKAAGSKVTTSDKPASLGKDDFLKLFVTQLTHQNPLEPMDDGAQMAQMAQFSTLEQTSNIATAAASLVSASGISQSLGLIGKTVTYTAEDGRDVTGVVSKVTTQDGASTLTVDGVGSIKPSAVKAVTQTPTTSQEARS